MHLIIDGYVNDPEKIKDKEFIYRFLDMYPQKIEMTKVSTPQVSEYNLQEQGISGFVLLAESHISIHIFPEQSYVNIDIFSCAEFDTSQAARQLEQQFGLTGTKTQILDRPQSDIL
ncbi:MAG: adenosylmethionine decarboxylase [Dehalococcoidia bacterium]